MRFVDPFGLIRSIFTTEVVETETTHGPCTAAACTVAIPVWHEAALCPSRPLVPPKQRDFLVRCPLRNFAKLNIFDYYLRSKFIQIVFF